MTRKEYANFFIDQYCAKNNIDRRSITDWGQYIHSNSSLAVCLEYLGMLTIKQMEYSRTRGGIVDVSHYDGNVNIITMREILEFLPEDSSSGIIQSKIEKGTVIDLVKFITDNNLFDYKLYVNGVDTIHITIDNDDNSIIIDSEDRI